MASSVQVSDEAAAWYLRLEGQMSPRLWDEFESWLDASPRHRAAFIRLRIAWNRCDRLKTLRPADGDIDRDLLSRHCGPMDSPVNETLTGTATGSMRKRTRLPGSLLLKLTRFLFSRRTVKLFVAPVLADMQHEYARAHTSGDTWRARYIALRGYFTVLCVQQRLRAPIVFGAADVKPRWPFRAAAGAALASVIYFNGAVLWSVFVPAQWIPYRTSVGGYENVILQDGSGVQLNTDTEIRARITTNGREIQLLRGEALINVSRDGHRPFTVRADEMSIVVNPHGETAVAFGVRLRAPRDVDVAVTQGSVLLDPSGRIADVAAGRESLTRYTLKSGQLANVRPEGIHVKTAGVEELNRRLSWTEGAAVRRNTQ